MSHITPDAQLDWERRLDALLPLYGHRNWIVVADAAYPAQSRPGIETIVAESEQIHAVRTVRDAISASRHARANIYVDQEIDFVRDYDAPGVADYRQQLEGVLQGARITYLPHEQIIGPGRAALPRSYRQDRYDDSVHICLL